MNRFAVVIATGLVLVFALMLVTWAGSYAPAPTAPYATPDQTMRNATATASAIILRAEATRQQDALEHEHAAADLRTWATGALWAAMSVCAIGSGLALPAGLLYLSYVLGRTIDRRGAVLRAGQQVVALTDARGNVAPHYLAPPVVVDAEAFGEAEAIGEWDMPAVDPMPVFADGRLMAMLTPGAFGEARPVPADPRRAAARKLVAHSIEKSSPDARVILSHVKLGYGGRAWNAALDPIRGYVETGPTGTTLAVHGCLRELLEEIDDGLELAPPLTDAPQSRP